MLAVLLAVTLTACGGDGSGESPLAGGSSTASNDDPGPGATADSEVDLPDIGEPFLGGVFAGVVEPEGGPRYALVLSPGDLGFSTLIAEWDSQGAYWNSGRSFPFNSTWDGLAITHKAVGSLVGTRRSAG